MPPTLQTRGGVPRAPDVAQSPNARLSTLRGPVFPSRRRPAGNKSPGFVPAGGSPGASEGWRGEAGTGERREPPAQSRAPRSCSPEPGSGRGGGRGGAAGGGRAAGGGGAASPRPEAGQAGSGGAGGGSVGRRPSSPARPPRSHSVAPPSRHGSCARPPGAHTCLSGAASRGLAGDPALVSAGAGEGRRPGAEGTGQREGRCAQGRGTEGCGGPGDLSSAAPETLLRPPSGLEGWDPRPAGAPRRLGTRRAFGFPRCHPRIEWGKASFRSYHLGCWVGIEKKPAQGTLARAHTHTITFSLEFCSKVCKLIFYPGHVTVNTPWQARRGQQTGRGKGSLLWLCD